MSGFNRVILMGNLTRDPEVKYLTSGTPVAKFGLAINEPYTDRNTGEKKENVCFVDVEAWDRIAEIASEYLKKGSPTFIEGSIKYDSWETETGEKRNKLSVRAQRLKLISNRGNGNGEQNGNGSYDAAPANPQAPPAQAPSVPTANSQEGADDDIPF